MDSTQYNPHGIYPGLRFSEKLVPAFAPSRQVGPEQTNFEAFYKFPINDNISITPAVIVITNPANDNGEPIIQGMLRTTFSF